MDKLDLSGKVALVTGAGRGLGRAIARRLSEAGARLMINFRERRGEASALAVELGRSQPACCWRADVSQLAEVERMLAWTMDRFGRLDVVVNNAGVMHDKTLGKMTREQWDAVIATNLTGTFNVCRAAVEHLSDGGRIINLASIAGVVGIFGQTNYAASKAGIIGMTRVLSRELARRKILVNAIAPGVVLTEIMQAVGAQQRQAILGAIPLGRFGLAEEIADAALFLASDLASYITGQTIHVNGGWWG